MITIPTEAVVQLARSVATSAVAQAAAGTVIGLCVFTGASAAYDRVTPAIGRAWKKFRTAAPILEGKAEAAAA